MPLGPKYERHVTTRVCDMEEQKCPSVWKRALLELVYICLHNHECGGLNNFIVADKRTAWQLMVICVYLSVRAFNHLLKPWLI